MIALLIILTYATLFIAWWKTRTWWQTTGADKLFNWWNS